MDKEDSGFSFEKLHVYHESIELVNLVYVLTKRWPSDERFGLIDQFHRATCSIVLNIAEGSSRKLLDFLHFLDIARGSCYECIAILAIARRREYISEKEYAECYVFIRKIARMLSALKKSLR